MNLDFNALRNTEASFEALKKKAEAMKGGFQREDDDTYWHPTKDKAGNAFATIRFLDRPGVDGPDSAAVVKLFTHSFQGPSGDWYIENCLSTINKKDPVQVYAAPLWKGTDEDQKVAKKIKRKANFISNILVINDPAVPENNGKVFKYKYGKKIWQKLEDAFKPPFPNMPPMNPFDMWKGANFQLRMRTVDGWPNYDLSSFDSPSPIGDDAYIEAVWKQAYSLAAIVAPSQFKEYDVLEKRFQEVMAGSRTPRPKEAPVEAKQPNLGETLAKEKEVVKIDDIVEIPADEGDDADEVNYFKNLADDTY